MSKYRPVFWEILLILAFISGCGGPLVQNPTPVSSPLVRESSTEPEYKIRVGDELDVKFFYNSDLNDTVKVRPDGRISLQLVGELIVAGMTPAALTAQLKQQYGAVLSSPEVTVIVRTAAGHKIYVDGEVNLPGLKDIIGPTSIRQSLVLAGGVKETARLNEILLIRQRKDQDPLIIAVNLEAIDNGTDLSQNIAVAPADIIFVPRSPIANVNLWVKQYLRDVLPFAPTSFIEF